MAKNGGVLTRAGHTEAGCDLARLAGLQPSSVIVEILNDDGTMARKKAILIMFAKKHNLKIGTIEELIKYRISKLEKLFKELVSKLLKLNMVLSHLSLRRDVLTSNIHFALVKNKISPEKPTLTRVHVQNTLTDAIGLLSPSSWPIDDALKKLFKSKQGVICIYYKYYV